MSRTLLYSHLLQLDEEQDEDERDAEGCKGHSFSRINSINASMVVLDTFGIDFAFGGILQKFQSRSRTAVLRGATVSRTGAPCITHKGDSPAVLLLYACVQWRMHPPNKIHRMESLPRAITALIFRDGQLTDNASGHMETLLCYWNDLVDIFFGHKCTDNTQKKTDTWNLA